MSDPNSLLKIMEKVIAPKLHLKTENDNSLTIEETQIEETQEEPVCKKVTIRLKKSMPYFAFSLDKKRNQEDQGDPIYPFFNPKIGCICSKNDAVLCLQKSKKIYILLIELKSKNKKGYLKQLLAAKGLIEFIWQRLQLCKLSGTNTHDLELLEFRGLLFSSRKTPGEGTTKHEQPLIFKYKEGLPVAELECNNNKIYRVQQFLDAN